MRTEANVSVWEKAMLAASLQRWWADNQVSCTLTFRPDERDEIGPLLRNFDGQLKSVSFLPLTEAGAYKQMPYESLPEGRWEELCESISPIDWDGLYGEARAAEGERFCANDKCELPG